MKKIVFTEEFCQPENLFPFSLTRHIQDLRVGILTIREKWEQMLDLPSFDKKEGDYKDTDSALTFDHSLGKDRVLLVHGNILPTRKLIRQVKKLKPGDFLSIPGKESIVYCISASEITDPHKIRVKKAIESNENFREIRYPWHIFQFNDWGIREDFTLLTEGRRSQKISSTNRTSGDDIFLEKGVKMEHCIINASEGPVYIGKDALIMEGSILRGPVAIGEGSVVKMGTKIYGATTAGPHCTLGGEIKNSVLFGYSNKAHDGYLGDSVLGYWCNLGAGTSNSNLKNTASDIKVWMPGGHLSAGLKCGMFMGDYSRTSINTSVNTGTMIGVCAHVFGQGLTPKYIPSFSWGSDGIQRYEFQKAVADISNWMRLKKGELAPTETQILKHIFDHY